jgi:lipopolysaccharide export LptBFGC system permease protein LptF
VQESTRTNAHRPLYHHPLISRPLITIWRYTLSELWRLVLLTAVTIVAVIGFALTVKFFADGALGPLQTLKFMAIASVPMLQYALPFAGGFAATMVYHRLTQENELTGARAAGISHRALLVPAAATGIALAITLSILSELVIPRMLLSMESLVTQSVTKVITNSVRQGKQIDAGRLRIYADDVNVDLANPNDLNMTGVVLQRINTDDSIAGSAIARSAHIRLTPARQLDDQSQPGRGATIVRIRLYDVSGEAGEGILAQTALVEYAVAIPSRFDDDPKFLTHKQLRQAYQDPDRLSPVADRRINLARHLALRQIIQQATNDLHSTQQLKVAVAGGSTYIINASTMIWNGTKRQGWRFEPLQGNDFIEIQRIGNDATVTQRAAFAILSAPWSKPGAIVEVGDETSDQRVEFDLTLDDVRTVTGSGEVGQRKRHTIRRLTIENDPTPSLIAKPSDEILKRAEPHVLRENPDTFIQGPYNDLTRRIDRIRREIKGKQHERIAMSLSCLVMSLAGAVTAMRLAAAQPLVVYLWSFFPSLLTVLAISAGQPMIEKSPGPAGYIVLWGGIAAFTLYTLLASRSLRSS